MPLADIYETVIEESGSRQKEEKLSRCCLRLHRELQVFPHFNLQALRVEDQPERRKVCALVHLQPS